MVVLQLLVHSVSITTKVVISNATHGDEYSTQYYAIKLVNDFRNVGGCRRVVVFPPPKTMTATI